mmetsp:Transcript_79033/g.131940  ORF Transcript_79033/g.131940 Transcript_79033/m.131940 type:complete len:98 (-) Transcript_79033:271-564(-)
MPYAKTHKTGTATCVHITSPKMQRTAEHCRTYIQGRACVAARRAFQVNDALEKEEWGLGLVCVRHPSCRDLERLHPPWDGGLSGRLRLPPHRTWGRG